MEKNLLSDFTEGEFLSFVTSICNDTYDTEEAHINAVRLFRKVTEHPDGSDLFYYPKPGVDNTPAGIVKTVKEWRAANGKAGFKSA